MKTKFYLLSIFCSIIATATVWSQNPFTLSADGKTLEKWKGTDPTADMTAYPELEDVTTIAFGAFNGNTTLESITISKNVTTIDQYTFAWMGNIKNIFVAEGNGFYSDVDGVLFDWGKTILFSYPRAKTEESYVVPSTVTKIGGLAFHRNMNLKKITLPAEFSEIQLGETFWAAAQLDTVSCLGKVTSIPASTFSDCYVLKSVTLPDELTLIGSKAFNQCQSLSAITIPANVTSIGDQAFFNNIALTEIVCLSATPPTLGGNNVFTVNPDATMPARTLYVPVGSKAKYETDWEGKFTGTIEEENPAGIGELEGQSGLTIRVKDNKFQVKGDGSELSFNIFNSTGQLVQSLSNLSESIDQNLKGLYIVNVKRAGEAIKSFKIIL